MSNQNPNRNYGVKEGTDRNGRKYTRTVRADDQKAAAVAATGKNGMILPAPPTMSEPATAIKPTITTDANGTVAHYDSNHLLHRDGGEPAVVYANGQVEYHHHGECVARSMPGLTLPNHVSCSAAMLYIKQPNGTRKPVLALSNNVAPAVPARDGEPDRYVYRGVPCESQAEVNEAKLLPTDEWDLKNAHRREELIPIGDKFAYDPEPTGVPVTVIHRPTILGAGLNDEGFNKYGENISGFNSEGITSDGYNRDGFHTVSGLDREGFAEDGFNERDTNREGYDRKGVFLGIPVNQRPKARQSGVGATDGSYAPRARTTPPAGAPSGWMPPKP